MKDYLNFSATELAQDEKFQAWVKYPGKSSENDRFWTKWVNDNPHKQAEVEEARQFILAVLSEGDVLMDGGKEEDLLIRIRTSITTDIHDSDLTLSTPKEKSNKWFLRIAAGLIIFFVAGGLVWWKLATPDTRSVAVAYTNGNFVKEINNSDKPKTLVFEDGTSIVLQPKSSIQYPEVFDRNFREVRLSGEGFFEVQKDPTRPFLVYADKVVTKVLGTSFIVRAFEHETTLRVMVKTGKVSVFTESDLEKNKQNGNKMEGMLLSPNQQIIFAKDDARMTRSLVDNPSLLPQAESFEFEFKERPLREVFATLENAYGVEIIFDEEVLGGCKLNASLNDLPLYDKMRLICKGVNAEYEILDSRIVVSGKGCKEWEK